ncbi:MAG: thioredoxin [Candidatus Aenigmatarchaeota archaeon]
MTTQLNDENFNEFVQNNKLVLIDFYADWCGPCKALSPIIEELEKEMKGKVAFGKINVESSEKTSSKYGIMAVPTMIVFKGGKLVDRFEGLMPKEIIKKRLEKFL